jgi:hypothetical protein
VITLSPQGRRLLSLLYVAAVLISLDQLIDLLGGVWPFQFGVVGWRFGAFGLGVARLEFLALADALAVATAIFLEHRRVLLFLGAVHLLLGLFLVAGLGLFMLDGLQIRRMMRPERVRQLDVAALRTLAAAGSACLACFAVSIVVWRNRQLRSKEEKPREGFLVSAAKGPAHE